jgi:hypothetical protein
MTDGEYPTCTQCIEHCEVCDNEKTCNKCHELYPASEDNTECVDMEGNSSKFFALYVIVVIFAASIVFLCGCCWLMRSCWSVCLRACPCCYSVDKFFERVFPCLKDIDHRRGMDDNEEHQQLK